MARFEFRLQKVLEYRERLEAAAKDAYLDARAQRLEAESKLDVLAVRRREALGAELMDLKDHQELEAFLQFLDDEERAHRLVIQALQMDEDERMKEWQAARQDLEALIKLRDKALEEWKLEETRREQAELDEWAVLRRTKGAA